MLTVIGPGSSINGDGDVVDALVDCHKRIRAFLALARRLAAAGDVPEADARDAAARVRRYFTVALPLHALDEDESVLPRLRGRDAAVDQALRAMHRDHEEHGPLVDRLVSIVSAISDRPAERPSRAADLAEVVDALDAHFAAHLDREEAVIFPAIRRLLDEPARQAIAAELRARRAGTGGQVGVAARAART